MSKQGAIIILEDDTEDQELFRDALMELGFLNELIFFNNGVSGLEYLQSSSEQPFVIFCDINLPLLNGLQLREHIEANEHLRKKSIPFIFYTTSSNQHDVEKAYSMTVQGYFTKENTFGAMKETLKMILDYWGKCKHPNSSF